MDWVEEISLAALILRRFQHTQRHGQDLRRDGRGVGANQPLESVGVRAPVNLEKAFLHTWPYVHRFDEIQAKYGRKIRIRNFAEEE